MSHSQHPSSSAAFCAPSRFSSCLNSSAILTTLPFCLRFHNYFGRTQYIITHKRGASDDEFSYHAPVAMRELYDDKPVNAFSLLLTVDIRRLQLIMPTKLYDTAACPQPRSFADLQRDTRDPVLSAKAIHVALHHTGPKMEIEGQLKDLRVSADGGGHFRLPVVNLEAFILNGPRFKGIRPTYAWNVDGHLGKLQGAVHVETLAKIAHFLQCYVFHAQDFDNLLPAPPLEVQPATVAAAAAAASKVPKTALGHAQAAGRWLFGGGHGGQSTAESEAEAEDHAPVAGAAGGGEWPAYASPKPLVSLARSDARTNSGSHAGSGVRLRSAMSAPAEAMLSTPLTTVAGVAPTPSSAAVTAPVAHTSPMGIPPASADDETALSSPSAAAELRWDPSNEQITVHDTIVVDHEGEQTAASGASTPTLTVLGARREGSSDRRSSSVGDSHGNRTRAAPSAGGANRLRRQSHGGTNQPPPGRARSRHLLLSSPSVDDTLLQQDSHDHDSASPKLPARGFFHRRSPKLGRSSLLHNLASQDQGPSHDDAAAAASGTGEEGEEGRSPLSDEAGEPLSSGAVYVFGTLDVELEAADVVITVDHATACSLQVGRSEGSR